MGHFARVSSFPAAPGTISLASDEICGDSCHITLSMPQSVQNSHHLSSAVEGLLEGCAGYLIIDSGCNLYGLYLLAFTMQLVV